MLVLTTGQMYASRGVPAAVRARCGYWGCSVEPFIQSQSGGMVTPQSPPGTIYNSSPGRPSPGEVVQIPDVVCAHGARAVRILPLGPHYRSDVRFRCPLVFCCQTPMSAHAVVLQSV